MTSILDLQDKLSTAGAALGRLESELSQRPESRALRSNVLSLQKLHRNLEVEFQQAADSIGLDVCRYRMLEDHPPAKAFASAIGDFQDAFSLTYDALRHGPKDRRNITPDVAFRTELRVAYAFPGSFGMVFTIMNSRLMLDLPTYLDEAIQAVFSVARAHSDVGIVSSVAHQVGRAPIAAIYDWAKANAQHQVGAQIEWIRDSSIREDVIIQAPEFRALSDAMERTSEKTTTKETIIGVLVGADTQSRRFHFIADGAEESIRGKFTSAISESQQAQLPARYLATLTKTTEIRFATEKEENSYFLERLEPASH